MIKLYIVEIKNNKKRSFILEKDYKQARQYLIKLYYSNKIIYCECLEYYSLNEIETEELHYWQGRKIQNLLSKGKIIL